MRDLTYGEARRRFWERAACAALQRGLVGDTYCQKFVVSAAKTADLMLVEWEARWVKDAPDKSA